MEAKSGIPKQVQIVRTDGKSMRLNEEALQKLLSANHIKDKPVAVVSVCGPLRSGKSFLLGFFLRFLHGLHLDNWLGDPNAPLKGFKWRGGPERHTVGIVVWDEVFLVKTSSGEEIAVLLMDTQGMYDCESTVQQTANIFALTALTSSVQVYNIWTNIQENDLQYLEFFSEYGRLVKEQMEGKPFQKLQFLVRDWYYPNVWAYGFTGGRRFLSERLRTYKGQHEQLKQRRENIDSNFKEVDCFLMPHPGLKVATEKSFDGRLRDIDEDFTTQLSSLIPSLLSPDNLIAKEINNKKITCHQLIAYFKSIVDVFNSGEIPKPVSLYQVSYCRLLYALCDRVLRRQATAETSNRTAMMDAWNLYQIAMHQKIDEWFDQYAGDMTQTSIPRQFWNTCLDTCLDKCLEKSLMAQIGAVGGLGVAAFVLGAVSVPVGAAVCASLSAGLLASSAYTVVRKCKKSNNSNSSQDATYSYEPPSNTDTWKALSRRGASQDSGAAETMRRSEIVHGPEDICFLELQQRTDRLEEARDLPLPLCDPTRALTHSESVDEDLKTCVLEPRGNVDGLEQICGEDEPYISLAELDWHHCNQRQLALEKFATFCKANGMQLPENIITELKQEMDEAFETFANLNQRKHSVLVGFQSWLRGTTDQSAPCRFIEV
ncbi:hypothetical protein HPB50_000436 [Hyalomma asiaticum]|uniref:Uncharacterized protein n=1 Tax=Hyalomma asiaticum TaxID=266040 RepID=A0ACB7RNH7_HYAAI|nr:hypothetical protein HPB50_000436 [Hyalomma asiaticum]